MFGCSSPLQVVLSLSHLFLSKKKYIYKKNKKYMSPSPAVPMSCSSSTQLCLWPADSLPKRKGPSPYIQPPVDSLVVITPYNTILIFQILFQQIKSFFIFTFVLLDLYGLTFYNRKSIMGLIWLKLWNIWFLIWLKFWNVWFLI